MPARGAKEPISRGKIGNAVVPVKEPSAKQRLIESAFALFDDRGYEQTTVDDITERAGLSRSTFFRTFRSKEEVIFPDHEEILAAIRSRLASSTDRTALVAVREAARLVLRHYLDEGPLALARYRLTRTVPALRDREIAGSLQYHREFREFIHAWMGGDPDSALPAELMAGAVVTAHNYVLRRWLRGLTACPDQEFDTAITAALRPYTTGSADREVGSIVVLRSDRDLEAILPALRAVLDPPG